MQANIFNHIGIIGKYNASYVGDVITRVMDILQSRQFSVTLDAQTMPKALRNHPRAMPIPQWSSDIDLAIVIGGDGTFLHAGRELLDRRIPLLGIHSGRLGFLADLPHQGFEDQLKRILNGDYSLEQRQTLKVIICRNTTLLAKFQAINDAVVHKRRMARMVELHVSVNDCFLSHYRADGLILSTPTGSTAYALSAGGPIIEPSLEAILVTPICPHTLTQRPVVINSDSRIEIDVSKNNFKDIQVTIDGQEEQIIEPGDKIVITKGGRLPVIHPSDYHFQDRLRYKLNWGLSVEEINNERYA